MRNLKLLVLVVLLSVLSITECLSQRKMESLDRGVVAINVSSGVYVGWRIQGTELINVAYNVYRDGLKINTESISNSSNYVDDGGTELSTYTVTAIVDGVESAQSKSAAVWGKQYLDIPVSAVDGTWSTYQINDASVGDLDGDGEYEIIVKRLGYDRSIESTDYNLLEAYKLDGTFMWRINLGPNIHNAVETNFLVYDFDEDGKAEIATRTSDGMIDGIGTNIGDRDGDGTINYRYSFSLNSSYYRTEGPDYISIFDGETGEELAWDNYIERDPISQWGTPGMKLGQYAHRATKCMWTVAYLDGKRPSMVNSRGIYHRTKMEAWDWDGTNLTKRWAFDSGSSGDYYGQGNHNLSCADVDSDGCDEVVYGSMIVDNDGKGLNSTGLGHGDALHVSDMDPYKPGLEIWQAQENATGATYRDAATGEILIRYNANRDCGRACAGDIDPNYKGFEMWAAISCPMYNVNGAQVGSNNVPMNYMIWWDGDLGREFLNHAWSEPNGIGTISKYDSDTKSSYEIFRADGTYSNNWTKGTPCIQADIIGDWREEVIWKTTDEKNVRLYTTINPTAHRIPTLMHEPQYRIAVAWQNNSYNQPPHTGVYLGYETEDIVPYPMINGKKEWNGTGTWDTSSSNWKDEDGNSIVYVNDDDVIFDFVGDNSQPIDLSTTLTPHSVLVNSFTDYEFSGSGKLSGSMDLLKSGTGSLLITNAENDYTGITKIYQGDLFVDGDLTNSQVEICMLANFYTNGVIGGGLINKSDGLFNIGLEKQIPTHLTSNNDVSFNEGSNVYFDLSDEPTELTKTNDQLIINGDFNVNGKMNFRFHRLDGALSIGFYDIITFTGSFNGTVNDIIIEGIDDVACQIVASEDKISLEVLETRDATAIKWSGSTSDVWDCAGVYNWLNEGVSDWFLSGDNVTFNDDGLSQRTVSITESVDISSMTVNSTGDYTFDGAGSITGVGGLAKLGSGKLFIQNTNSFTGPVELNGGYVEVPKLTNGGIAGPLGAGSTDSTNFMLNGTILRFSNSTVSSNRDITIGSLGATFYINPYSEFSISGNISGDGELIKDGEGLMNLISGNYHAGGTVVSSGVLALTGEESNIHGFGTGGVTIKNATVQMYSNVNSETEVHWDINVPSGFNATLELDSRCDMYGALSGSGTLNLTIPYTRSALYGDWSAFEGSIYATTTSSLTRNLLLGNANGYANSSIHLGDHVLAIYRNSGNATIDIGELSGTLKSKLGAGGDASDTVTWKIGGKSTSTTFDGMITNNQYQNSGAKAAIIKTGTGRWTLTNSNIYSGGTIIEKGTLIADNTSGSATGTGDVLVMGNAALAGSGIIGGAVTVSNRGYIMPANNGAIGAFTVNNDINFNDGARLYIETDAATEACDQLIVSGTATLSGTLFMVKTAGSYELGQDYRVLNCSSTIGNFTSVNPVTPGEGLYWDLSKINTSGVVSVTDIVSVNENALNTIKVYPNPANDLLNIDLHQFSSNCILSIEAISGTMEKQYDLQGGGVESIDVSMLSSGIYVLKVKNSVGSYTTKIVIE